MVQLLSNSYISSYITCNFMELTRSQLVPFRVVFVAVSRTIAVPRRLRPDLRPHTAPLDWQPDIQDTDRVD